MRTKKGAKCKKETENQKIKVIRMECIHPTHSIRNIYGMKLNKPNESLGRTMFDFLVAVFAVYRSTRMFNKEPGPEGLIDRFRNWMGTEEQAKVRGSLGEGIRCPYCTSIWMSILTSLYYAMTGRIPWAMVPVYVFSLSGSALGIILGYRRAEMAVEESEESVEGHKTTHVPEVHDEFEVVKSEEKAA